MGLPFLKAGARVNPFFSLVLGNIGSKFVGVLREVVFAALFGTSSTAAAYRLSQMALYAPTHALVLETVSGGLLPLYKKSLDGGAAERQALVVVAVSVSLFASLVIGLALFLFDQQIALFLAGSADARTITLSASMVRLMGLAVPLYVAGNLITFIETAHGHFTGISWRPTLLNITTLVAAWVAAWTRSPVLLATGALASHGLFLIWTLHYAIRKGIIRLWLPRGRELYRRALRSYLINSLPLLLLPLIGQAVLVIERVIAGRIGTAVIAGVDYARFITDTLLTMSSVPLGLILLSQHGGRRDEEAMQNLRSRTLLLMIFAFPAGFFLSLNATDVVRVVFTRGAFDNHSINAVAPILKGMGWGLGATVVSYFQLKALNAQLRNIAAVAITGVAGIGNLAVDLGGWHTLGALALGMGVSTYGIVAFTLCSGILGMWRSMLSTLACVGVVLLVTIAATWLASPLGSPLLRLIVAGLVSAAGWGAVSMAMPATRAIMLALIEGVGGRRRAAAQRA